MTPRRNVLDRVEIRRDDGTVAMLIARGTGAGRGGYRCTLYHTVRRTTPRATHRVIITRAIPTAVLIGARGSAPVVLLVCRSCAGDLARPVVPTF